MRWPVAVDEYWIDIGAPFKRGVRMAEDHLPEIVNAMKYMLDLVSQRLGKVRRSGKLVYIGLIPRCEAIEILSYHILQKVDWVSSSEHLGPEKSTNQTVILMCY